MDGIDRKIIAELYEKHVEFRRLYDEHQKLHDELSKYEKRNYLSPKRSKRNRIVVAKRCRYNTESIPTLTAASTRTKSGDCSTFSVKKVVSCS